MQGLILINKPKDITSFRAVAVVRRLLGEKRIGHTGTLDPLATGVLPILIGKATALSSYITCAEKSYTARVRLGITTDTEDITGNILTENTVNVDALTLSNTAAEFLGDIKQIPPMYSAISRDGVRLYELARRGETVEREPRDVTVYNLEVSDFDGTEFTLSVRCSKGTYIRSLCRDIGEKLGCGAVLTELVRTETAGFPIEKTVSLDDLTEDNIGEYILPSDIAVESFPCVCVSEKQAVRFSNGGELDLDRLKYKDGQDGELCRVKFGKILLGIGRIDKQKNCLWADCVINNVKGEL